MLKKFLPNQHVKSIFQITPESLKEQGIKGIITDLDNTLVEWDRPNATPKLTEWFENMRKENIRITIVSNNNRGRVQAFSDPLNIPFIFQARKPLVRAFHKAVKDMGLKKEETVVIGDQLLTDVLGGNRGGFHTVLVVPVASTDGFWTKFNRMIERQILNWFRKKGMIVWEEKS
ncbi:YqeG family HAD IIIA-type phosphatase [Robertmurraya massiliosenegalensis]|uniref:YqeG family HAD IIIA-type phosphatase n=1 Tax=Robertmurraya TaxID=2837507 RepID=UPI0039A497EA